MLAGDSRGTLEAAPEAAGDVAPAAFEEAPEAPDNIAPAAFKETPEAPDDIAPNFANFTAAAGNFGRSCLRVE